MRLALAAALLSLMPQTAGFAAGRPIAFSATPAAGGALVLPLSGASDLARHSDVLDRFVRDFRAVPADADRNAR